MKTRPFVRNASGELILPREGYGGDPGLLLEVMANVHRTVARRSADAGALVRSVVTAQADLGLAVEALPALSRQDGETTLTTAEWTRLGSALAAARRRHRRGFLDEWLPTLAKALSLDETEAAVLRLAVAYRQDTHVEGLWDALCRMRWRSPFLCLDPALFGLLLGRPGAAIVPALAPDGRLRASGLIAVDEEDGSVAVLSRLYALLARRVPLPDDVRALLVSQPRPPELAWEAFRHLGEVTETAARVLRAALEGRERGVGILLYGPPGTGKTAFAATLAAHVGASLYPVGETDAAGEEPTRGERLADLRLSQRLIDGTGGVLLFDEMEDLFAINMFGRRDTASRVFLHRLIEQGGAPVIWTANDISTVGPAVARRMMLCIEVRQPGVAARARLWTEVAAGEGVALSSTDASDLARSVPAAPGVLRNAMRAVRLAGGDSAMARSVATGIARAVEGGALPPPQPGADPDYDATLVRADCDLAALARRLAAPGAPRAVSLLLSGPPGTGKSAYARHLADLMGLPALQKRASDLFGPYVGQSEAQIAAAFAEAREAGAVLIFDEADSLLSDRRGARVSWEVTQVNEMLTWMESHPLPFVCTTNLVDRLDQASMRRFLIKARFDYLDATQVEAAFARFFALAAPAGLTRLRTLTPADFALVRRRAALAEAPPDAAALLALLAAESVAREGGRPIGFGV